MSTVLKLRLVRLLFLASFFGAVFSAGCAAAQTTAEATKIAALLPADAQAVIERLARSANEAVKSEDVLAAFKTQGIDALGSGPEEFSTYVKSEVEKWAKVVRAAGVKR